MLNFLIEKPQLRSRYCIDKILPLPTDFLVVLKLNYSTLSTLTLLL